MKNERKRLILYKNKTIHNKNKIGLLPSFFIVFDRLSVVQMSFCGLIKGISPKICILCVRVKINKRSFEPFCVWIWTLHKSGQESLTSQLQIVVELKVDVTLKQLPGDIHTGPVAKHHFKDADLTHGDNCGTDWLEGQWSTQAVEFISSILKLLSGSHAKEFRYSISRPATHHDHHLSIDERPL